MAGSRSGKSVSAWLLWLAVLAVSCGEPLATPEAVYLRASGSMEMSSLMTDLAAAFHETDPLVRLDVTGLGTHYGLEAFRRGEVDLALASWLPAELDPDWQAVGIARDGLAIIVHPSNPVDGLGLLQLRDLFDGGMYDWNGVGGRAAQGPIQPVSREEGSGSRAAFETMVMGDRRVTPNAVVMPSGPAVVEYVAEHPGAVGYISMGDISPQVKALKIEGESPTPETVGRGSYPLSRELWLVMANPPAEAVGGFVAFVLSPAGQRVVGERFGRIR